MATHMPPEKVREVKELNKRTPRGRVHDDMIRYKNVYGGKAGVKGLLMFDERFLNCLQL
jgi:hypothetical protein